LIAKAYDAVPVGGAVIVYDAMVDPARPHNFASDLSSPNIVLETRAGFEANAVNFTVFAGQCLSSGKGVAAVMFWMTHCGLIERR